MEKTEDSGSKLRKNTTEEDVLLKSLPSSVKKFSSEIGLKKISGEYIKEFLTTILPPSAKDVDEFTKYIFTFEKRRKKKRNRCTESHRANQLRKLALFKLDKTSVKFENFLPLHNLWEQYMKNVLQLKDVLPNDMSGLYQKLIKADFHGCFLVVASANCSPYIGIRGIVLQETRNVFRLVTEKNKLKTIPKKGSVFCFELQGKLFKIYGNNFRFLPYDRLKLKYKTKSLVNFYE